MPRSYHFIPANKPKLFNRIASLGADAYVFDLEDAVPGKEKVAAIAQLSDWLRQQAAFDPLYVRLNGPEHALSGAERSLIKEFPNLGVVLPKVESPASLSRMLEFYRFEPRHRLIGLIESPSALENLNAILEVKALEGVGLGLEDFLAASIYTPVQVATLVAAVRSKIALAAMAWEIAAIDTISLDFTGGAAMQAEAESARSAGCTGKFSIHPTQISAINNVFSPEGSLIDTARQLKDSLAEIDDESGYVQNGATLLSPPKIKKLKKVLEWLGD